VNGHLLVISLNAHLSSDNTIRLSSEVSEHRVRLDTYEARVQEARHRLALGDQKAFHGTGITDEDLQWINRLLLGWIGIRAGD
jgi:hypothetical protein